MQWRRRVSIHVPLAEHDDPAAAPAEDEDVSIHVPLAEHDPVLSVIPQPNYSFNSRAPRGARHAALRRRQREFCFNSRAPRGARPGVENTAETPRKFQFTCPSRSTTRPVAPVDSFRLVSIHVPLAEHDVSAQVHGARHAGFNSRAPRGARPA